MDALDLLQMHANLRQDLLTKAFVESSYGDETCIRDYGDLTTDHDIRRIDLESDDDE